MHFRQIPEVRHLTGFKCSFLSLAGANQYKLTPHLFKLASFDFGGHFGHRTKKGAVRHFGLKLLADCTEMKYQTKYEYGLQF